MSDPAPSTANSIRFVEIVSAVIRMLAIQLGLTAFGYFASALVAEHQRPYLISIAIVVAGMAVCACWLWKLSPFLARHITRGQDSSISTADFTLVDLYRFAFLLTGLYFAVDSFGSCLTWLHFSVTQSSSEARITPQQTGNYYTLFKYLVKFVLGLVLTLNGRKLAIRLIKHQDSV